MHGFFPWGICIVIIAFDQISKAYVSGRFLPGESIPILKDIFHISLVHNAGVAFGLFKNYGLFFVAFSLIIMSYIVRDLTLNHERYSGKKQVALSLILGGACGNCLDRLRLGYIVDFLDFRVWPVFNIADSAITIGIILLGAELFLKSKCRNEANPKF